jgi:hypothetical protein
MTSPIDAAFAIIKAVFKYCPMCTEKTYHTTNSEGEEICGQCELPTNDISMMTWDEIEENPQKLQQKLWEEQNV